MAEGGAGDRLRAAWLLGATLVVSVAGLSYELIAGTVSTYLLGDGVRQFSFVIGLFLSSMGVGAWASRWVGDAAVGFVRAQVGLGLIGGTAAALAFAVFAAGGPVAPPLYGALIAVGVLSGMEIPLLARLLADLGAGRFRFENVLSFDYLGALLAALAFPVLIVPNLSLAAAGLAFGLLNLAVAGGTLWLFRDRLDRGTWAAWGGATALVAGLLAASGPMQAALDARLYADPVVVAQRTPFQTITVTRSAAATRLFLDGAIQFDSRDEARYHEALVHPAMAQAPRRARVLILGGGDGMALREALRWGPERVVLVDLDPAVVGLFRDRDDLAALNGFALRDPRVEVVHADAFTWVRDWRGEAFDVVVMDLPDPRTITLSRLYTAEFLGMVARVAGGQGVMVTQASSPLFAREAFWITARTVGEAWDATPYRAYVPSFGMWGFVMGTKGLRPRQAPYPEGLSVWSPEAWAAARAFDGGMGEVGTAVNRLATHALPRAYARGWAEWFE